MERQPYASLVGSEPLLETYRSGSPKRGVTRKSRSGVRRAPLEGSTPKLGVYRKYAQPPAGSAACCGWPSTRRTTAGRAPPPGVETSTEKVTVSVAVAARAQM